MIISSLHFGLHDTSCVIYDGNIINYFIEERFSGIKHDNQIFYCCENLLKTNKKIDKLIVTCCSLKLIGLLMSNDIFINFIKKYKKKYNEDLKINFDIEHHRNHACNSFYSSGFDKSLVVVCDGQGKTENNMSECESVYIAQYPNSFVPIYKNYIKLNKNILKFNNNYSYCESKIGISCLYGSGANQIGQNQLDAGKSMALSSYGKSLNINLIDDLFVNDNDFFIEYDYEISTSKCTYKKIPIISEVTEDNYKKYADYAHTLQLKTQEVVCKLISKSIDDTGIKNVCITGGYGMNIIANNFYTKKFPDVNFYFDPLSTDLGCSIGCAMFYYRKETKDSEIKKIKDTFFHGFNYDISEYLGKDASINDIAKLLSLDKSVAVYRNLSESGQRALGNRSIFFNAFNPKAKEIVNKIKNREWYRPFAAVVLENDANHYFNIKKSSPFMTQCFDVKVNIPGVTHVDNTCRVQTVSDGYLYELLSEYKKITGHSILLNTSFNLAGKPLVETPKDAFYTLNNSGLDYLWFEETKQLFSS